MDLRFAAREIFLETLHRVSIRNAMHTKLHGPHGVLTAGDTNYNLSQFSRIIVLAVGKASVPMSEALLELLTPSLSNQHLEGLVITPSLPERNDPRIRYLRGSHPLPDTLSFQAADAALSLLTGLDEKTLVFFLISGGASAMLERPLDSSFTDQKAIAFHEALVHSGLSIAEMNTLRKHFSAVKAGRLAVAAAPATTCTLIVSDTRPSDLDVVGSGISLPDNSITTDCRSILQSHPDMAFAAEITAWFNNPSLPETPKPDHPAFRNATWMSLLSSDDLCAAAQAAAEQRGFHAFIDLTCDEWNYSDAAGYLLNRMEEACGHTKPLCLISAGEISVPIHGKPGTGGRNQHFVLECARRIAETNSAVTILSAGSDGIDGNSPAAGAAVDLSTSTRAVRAGFSISEALDACNSYPLLHALGETIETGPTGNNLRDLRLLLAV